MGKIEKSLLNIWFKGFMFTRVVLGKSYVCLNGKSFLGHLAPLVLVGPF
jgi:hypothetical protein